MPEDETSPDFDLAVSFAGEQRAYVESVVRGLGDDLTTFYDHDHRVDMWGEDLVEYFTDLYQHRTRYVVVFISGEYDEKMWTRLERRSALATALQQRGAYILPVRLDDTDLPGFLPTAGYLDARIEGLQGIISAIHQKLGNERTSNPAEYTGRVPQSAEEMEQLLALRPDFWEYWLYAGTLKLGLDALHGKYLDYEMGFARPSGEAFYGRDAFDWLRPIPDNAGRIVQSFSAALNPEVQLRAFGELGSAGDPDRIVHIAQRFLDTYESFMDEATRIRAASLPEAFRNAQNAGARFGGEAVGQIREFITELIETMSNLPELADAHESDEPLEIRLVCSITVDESVTAEFLAGLQEGIDSLEE